MSGKVIDLERESQIGRVFSGALWLYLSTIVSNLQGFFFWMIISRLGGGEIVGILSVVVGLSSLVGGLVNLGINTGLSRFTGYCLGIDENPRKCATEYLWTASIFSLLVYTMGSLTILAIGYFFPGAYGYSRSMMLFAAIFNLFSFLGSFSSFLQSALQTKRIFLSVIISVAIKFILGISLFELGFGWKGVAVGYMMNSLLQGMINAAQSLRIAELHPTFSIDRLKELLRAGIPSWAPGLISTVGQWMGILVLYGSIGSLETGAYYIASQLSNVVIMISNAMNGLLLPVLSGMSDGRKRTGARVFRLSLALMMPIGVFVMIYPKLFLTLFGEDLSAGWPALTILLLSSPLVAYTSFVTSLLYAYGDYSSIFWGGTFTNLPRVFLYFIFAPMLGGTGVAITTVIGTIMGTLYFYERAKKANVFFDRRSLIIVLSVPYSIGLLLYLSKLSWIYGMLLLSLSYVLYIKLKIITLSDLREIGRALLGKERASALYTRLKPILEPLLE
ncbi:MAG: oligosaccharide flippase family protein [Fervidicoccaceae archaeon]